ncbi:MAG: V-type ATP synthase subunit D [Nitrospirota bacterium]|jgi:V/A-type H+-transporting ATPase subunit D
MIQPTRTNLLMLRDRARSVSNSIEILKTKRQALIVEFLSSSRPFLRSRREIKDAYGRAIEELSLSLGHEGRRAVESIAASAEKEPSVEITEGSIWGLKFKDVVLHESPVKSPEERHYDWRASTHHMEECIHLYEKLVDAVIKVAAFESKLKRLAEEITKTTRRTRVLEERILPRLRRDIKAITQFIDERDREAYYRLKRVKASRGRQAKG